MVIHPPDFDLLEQDDDGTARCAARTLLIYEGESRRIKAELDRVSKRSAKVRREVLERLQTEGLSSIKFESGSMVTLAGSLNVRSVVPSDELCTALEIHDWRFAIGPQVQSIKRYLRDLQESLQAELATPVTAESVVPEWLRNLVSVDEVPMVRCYIRGGEESETDGGDR